jgi:trigger factor
MPEILMPEYKGLEAIRRVRPVPSEQIDGIIDEKRQEGASLIPVEGRKSKTGDTVIIDLEGTFTGEEDTEPIRANDLEITLGDANIEKSFTENLAGLETDDEKEFTMAYPADFSAPALAGKTVNYKAKVKSVGSIELPELDDEWAQSLDEDFNSVKDMRLQITKDLEAMAKNEADMRVRNDLIGKLIEIHPIQIPNALIESQAHNLLNNFAQDLAGRGIDIKTVDENFIKMAYEQMKGQAENDVRGAILLEKIADAEKVEVSQEDIDQEIGYMAQYYSVSTDEVRKQQGIEANIANSLRTRKAVEVIFENAKIKDEEWIEEGEPYPIVEAETEEKAENKKAKGEKKAKDDKPKKKPSKKEKSA